MSAADREKAVMYLKKLNDQDAQEVLDVLSWFFRCMFVLKGALTREEGRHNRIGRKSSSLRCACCHCGMLQLGAFLDHCRVQEPEELPDHSLLRSTLVSFFPLLRVCFAFWFGRWILPALAGALFWPQPNELIYLLAPCGEVCLYYARLGDQKAVNIDMMKLRPFVPSVLRLQLSSKLWNENGCRKCNRRHGNGGENLMSCDFELLGQFFPCVNSVRFDLWISIVARSIIWRGSECRSARLPVNMPSLITTGLGIRGQTNPSRPFAVLMLSKERKKVLNASASCRICSEIRI